MKSHIFSNNILQLFLRGLLAFTIVCCWQLCAFAQDGMQQYPVPQTVSPQLQKFITCTPLLPYWNAHPRTPAEWQKLVDQSAKVMRQKNALLLAKLKVQVATTKLNGVSVQTLIPETVDPEQQGRVLLHIHGGGYVFHPDGTGIDEAIMMAAFSRMRVVSVDYRMPPKYPYPAALDDVFLVYKELLKTYTPKSIGVFGSSTGGGLTLALVLRAKAEGVPLPAAIAPGSPWSDLAKIGDTYFTHAGQDNVLVTYDGWLGEAARLYANGHPLNDPYLSPVYADVTGFPPALLTSGTRDLFLSNTVRMHLKFLQAGVPAELVVFEGMSHVLYQADPDIPEVQFHFELLRKFFVRNFQ